MSNTLANKRFVESLEAETKRLRQERAAAESVAKLAEERIKAANVERDEAKEAQSRALVQLEVCQNERAVLDDKLRKMEQRLHDENNEAHAGATAAIARARDAQTALDRANAKVTSLEADLALLRGERHAQDEVRRTTDELLNRLKADESRFKAAEEYNKELRMWRDGHLEEMSKLKNDFATLKAAKDGLYELHKRLEDEVARFQPERSKLLEKIEMAESQYRSAIHAKDAADAERSHAEQQLAVLQVEKAAAEERMKRTEVQLVEEKEVLCARAESAESMCREKLERLLAIAQEDKAAMQVRLEASEARLRELEAQKETAVLERQRLEHEQALAHSERRQLDEMNARSEQILKELQRDKLALLARAEAAEGRVADVTAMRDAAVEERARAVQNLGEAQAEKTAAEEATRRCERQIRALHDDKTSLLARMDQSEERIREALRQKDTAVKEHSVLSEQLSVAQSERRATEEIMRFAELRFGEERPALQQRAEFAERRFAELEGQRDSLMKEKAALMQALNEEKDAKADMSRTLAASSADRRALEELLHRTEKRVEDECTTLRTALENAENRALDLAKQRDEVSSERSRIAEALNAANSGRRAAEDATAKLTAVVKGLEDERTHMMERLGASEQNSKELSLQLAALDTKYTESEDRRVAMQREKNSIAQELAISQADLKGKEVLARHSEQKAEEEKATLQAKFVKAEELCQELRDKKDLMQAELGRRQEANETLLNERNQLEERVHTLESEARGLQDLAHYVHNTITRSNSAPGSASKPAPSYMACKGTPPTHYQAAAPEGHPAPGAQYMRQTGSPTRRNGADGEGASAGGYQYTTTMGAYKLSPSHMGTETMPWSEQRMGPYPSCSDDRPLL